MKSSIQMKSSGQRWDQGLYIVPTPIGNLADMSFRAVEALQMVDIILCEDTRTTKKLCEHYQIKTRLQSYHDHSDDQSRKSILDMLGEGKRLALVSDAGTPLISDPGYKLVRECVEQGIRVIPLPGANAVLPALQLSGFATDEFYFGGFLPAKTQARIQRLEQMMRQCPQTTLCFYESPKRLKACLEDIQKLAPTRMVSVCREISKLHEEALRGTAADILSLIADGKIIKGEIVLLLEGNKDDEDRGLAHQAEIVQIVQNLLATMSVKDISAYLAKITNMPKKDIYDIALKVKESKGL